MTPFQIHTYAFKELALLYMPDIAPRSASLQLGKWLRLNKDLHDALTANGWQQGARLLTPKQVGIIVQYLGEP